jgi:D-glycero-D-manno-heptose 1,7-bisphosphate phosphatase
VTATVHRQEGPAVFLDKDGTLIRDMPYNADVRQTRLLPKVGAGLRLLAAHGYRLIVISNRASGVRGMFAEQAQCGVEERLRDLLSRQGVTLTGFYDCPHGTAARAARHAPRRCSCHKPRDGMLMQAAVEHSIDLARSWMIGDILNDVEAAHRAGCRGVLIDNGNETEWKMTAPRVPDWIASDVSGAARLIIGEQRRHSPANASWGVRVGHA